MWNPWNPSAIPCGIHGMNVGWDHCQFIVPWTSWIPYGIIMEWSWNGQFHMESITIPHGFHWIPYGIWAYPPWIPWTSPHGFHGTSPYGFHGTNPDGINYYHICSVLTILSKNNFTLSQNLTLSHPFKMNAKAH